MTATERLWSTGLLTRAVRITFFSSTRVTSCIVAAGASEGKASAEDICDGGVTGAGAAGGKAGRGIDGGGFNIFA